MPRKNQSFRAATQFLFLFSGECQWCFRNVEKNLTASYTFPINTWHKDRYLNHWGSV
jgi:hypothetical protein